MRIVLLLFNKLTQNRYNISIYHFNIQNLLCSQTIHKDQRRGLLTLSFSSSFWRTTAGMSPRIPPPSMLSTVMASPYLGFGSRSLGHDGRGLGLGSVSVSVSSDDDDPCSKISAGGSRGGGVVSISVDDDDPCTEGRGLGGSSGWGSGAVGDDPASMLLPVRALH